MKKLKSNRVYKFVLFFVFLALLILPFTWSNLYHVGGDDSKLFYIFPLQMLKNFSLNIISDNGTGTWSTYTAPSYLSPFLAVIFLVKSVTPFLNTQLLFYGLTFSLGFLFFYLLLDIWIKNDDGFYFFSKILASLFYVFSPYLAFSLYLHRLLGIHLVAIIPAVLYFFIKGIYEKKYIYAVISCLIMSIFSSTLITLPYSGGVFLAVLPLFLYIFFTFKNRFLLSILIFSVLFLLLNAHWLTNIFNANFDSTHKTDLLSSINSSTLRNGDDFLITSVSKLNDINSVLFDTFGNDHKNPSFALIINIIFVEIIAVAGFCLGRVKKIFKELYAVTCIMFVGTLFLFSPDIGSWGLKAFLWLTHHVPGFIMFRNMYDKFGLAMAISFSLVFGISLKILIDSIKNNLTKKIIFVLLIFILFLNAKPIIFADKYKYPIYTTKNLYDSITDLNPDFYSLVKYMEKAPDPSRYLWFPINLVNYVAIADAKIKNHFYWGISPIQYLTKKQDFTATMGLGSSYDPGVGNKILEAIFNKDYLQVGKYLQKLNVKYFIVNNDVYKSREVQKSFLYDGAFFDAQNNKKLTNLLFGKKIKDFGSHYSLYEINPIFMSDKIFLTDDFNKIKTKDANLNVEKKASYKYTISIKNIKKETKLVFLDPYYKDWNLYFKNGKELMSENIFVLNYANGWIIDPKTIQKKYPKSFYSKNQDGSINLDIVLYFKPQQYFLTSAIISLLTLLGSVSYSVLYFLNRRTRKI